MESDAELLVSIYRCSRRRELAVVPWDDAQKTTFLRQQSQAQERSYHERFPHAEYNILLCDGQPAGRRYVAREAGQIHILDLTVLPAYRGRGIGGAALSEVQTEALAGNCVIHIYVDQMNNLPDFFLKRGFTRENEEGIHLLLRWVPAASSLQPRSG